MPLQWGLRKARTKRAASSNVGGDDRSEPSPRAQERPAKRAKLAALTGLVATSGREQCCDALPWGMGEEGVYVCKGLEVSFHCASCEGGTIQSPSICRQPPSNIRYIRGLLKDTRSSCQNMDASSTRDVHARNLQHR